MNILLTISSFVIENYYEVKSENSWITWNKQSNLVFDVLLCKYLWRSVLLPLKEKCIISNLQSLKITTIPFNALSFKAEKMREIPLDRFYSKLKGLFHFRKHEHSFRRKERAQRKSPTYHAVMHHCLNTIKITPDTTWGFSAELQSLVHQSLDVQWKKEIPCKTS